MRRGAKLIACGIVFAAFIGASLLARIVFLFASSATQKRVAITLTQIGARLLLRVLGIAIDVPNALPTLPPQGCLVVSNHQSYLDILVLSAHFPVQFVAKKDIASWPLIGWMAQLGNTIFIDRGSTRQSLKCAHEIIASLQQGVHVLVFPEGTSTNGTEVLPFKSLLFCAALKTGSPVLPLTLNYTTINEQPLNHQTRDLCCWHGEMEFVRHFWDVLSLQSIEVFLEAHDMLNPPHTITSQELAQRAYENVARRFTAPPTPTSATTAPPIKTIDATSEFLLGAVLMSLVNHEPYSLTEGDYGEA
jgi:1-acyl-sn-glycerol-3-phosphate acyltransferase